MKWFDIFHYQVQLFPQLTWQVTADAGRAAIAVAVLAGTSACYVLFSAVLSRASKRLAKPVQPYLNIGYLLSALYLLSRIAQSSLGLQLAPLSLLLRIIVCQLVLLTFLWGNRFSLVFPPSHPIKLSQYLRANYWLVLLSYSFYIFLFILFDVPIIDPKHRIVFIGTPIAALALYWPLVSLVHKKSFYFLGLHLDRNTLPEELEDKLETALQPLTGSTRFSLLIAKPGLRNALAIPSQNVIVVGLDLLRHLSVEELRAIFLHELGHLKDTKYLPRIRNIALLSIILYVLYKILAQANILPPFATGMIFFIGLWATAIIVKKLRLRAEFFADSFVKDFSTDIYSRLTSAIERVYEINGIDKDYCKKHNVGHLDPDERAGMVANGTFALKRKTGKTFLVTFVPTLVLVIAIQAGYSYLFPDEIKKWKKMHDRYHELVGNDQYQQAKQTIQKALHYSVESFGENHRRTYISLNDSTSISLLLNDVPRAETYALRAMQVGISLYHGNNSEQVKAMKNLATVKTRQKQWQDAEIITRKILELQQKVQASPESISATMFSLLDLYALQNKKKQLEAMLPPLFDIYEKQEADFEHNYLISDMASAGSKLFLRDDPELAQRYFQKLSRLLEKKHGRTSVEYAFYLSEYGDSLIESGSETEAAKAFKECIAIYDSYGLKLTEEYPSCLHGLEQLAFHNNELKQAEQYVMAALAAEKTIYGRNSSEICYSLYSLNEIYQKKGEVVKARQCFRTMIAIEEDDPIFDTADLLNDYNELVSLLDPRSDTEEIASLKEKIRSIKAKK